MSTSTCVNRTVIRAIRDDGEIVHISLLTETLNKLKATLLEQRKRLRSSAKPRYRKGTFPRFYLPDGRRHISTTERWRKEYPHQHAIKAGSKGFVNFSTRGPVQVVYESGELVTHKVNNFEEIRRKMVINHPGAKLAENAHIP